MRTAKANKTAEADDPPSRAGSFVLRPRRRLPSGRAVAGGFLVTLAALGAFLVATNGKGEPKGRFVVVTHDVAPGATLTATDLQVIAVDLPAEQARVTARSVTQVQGAVTRGPLSKGAFVHSAEVGGAAPEAAALSTTYRELSVAVAAGRAVAGSIRPGDRVDVLASSDGATFVLAQQVLVIGATSGGNSLGGDHFTVTLALDKPEAVLAIVHGASNDKLTLVRSTRTDDTLPGSYQLPRVPTIAPAGTTPSPAGTTPSTVHPASRAAAMIALTSRADAAAPSTGDGPVRDGRRANDVPTTCGSRAVTK